MDTGGSHSILSRLAAAWPARAAVNANAGRSGAGPAGRDVARGRRRDRPDDLRMDGRVASSSISAWSWSSTVSTFVGIEIISRLQPFGQSPSEDDNASNTFDYVSQREGDTLGIWAGEKVRPRFLGFFDASGCVLDGPGCTPGGGGYSSTTDPGGRLTRRPSRRSAHGHASQPASRTSQPGLKRGRAAASTSAPSSLQRGDPWRCHGAAAQAQP